jgi:hypothetical protein
MNLRHTSDNTLQKTTIQTLRASFATEANVICSLRLELGETYEEIGYSMEKVNGLLY